MTETPSQPDGPVETSDDGSDKPSDDSDRAKRREAEMEESGEENAA